MPRFPVSDLMRGSTEALLIGHRGNAASSSHFPSGIRRIIASTPMAEKIQLFRRRIQSSRGTATQLLAESLATGLGGAVEHALDDGAVLGGGARPGFGGQREIEHVVDGALEVAVECALGVDQCLTVLGREALGHLGGAREGGAVRDDLGRQAEFLGLGGIKAPDFLRLSAVSFALNIRAV